MREKKTKSFTWMDYKRQGEGLMWVCQVRSPGCIVGKAEKNRGQTNNKILIQARVALGHFSQVATKNFLPKAFLPAFWFTVMFLVHKLSTNLILI